MFLVAVPFFALAACRLSAILCAGIVLLVLLLALLLAVLLAVFRRLANAHLLIAVLRILCHEKSPHFSWSDLSIGMFL